MWLATIAGFSLQDAFELAKYDQATDDDPMTLPDPGLSDMGLDRRALWHFVDGVRLSGLKAAAFSCSRGALTVGQYKRIGQYLHALEDVHSHRRHDPTYGQLWTGRGPDLPWDDPGAFRQMGLDKFVELSSLLDACSARAADGSRSGEIIRRFAFEVDAWAREEYRAGTRGDQHSPARWERLMAHLYGDSIYALRDAERTYDTWVQRQRKEGWKWP
jgi:hypothetical protein